MNNALAKQPMDRGLAVILALIAIIGVGGISAWLAMGDKLFWSLIQSGLAWCF